MIQLEKEQFSMLAGAIPFVAKEEEYRRYLNGVFFEFNGETCSIVATDTRAMFFSEFKCNTAGSYDFIMPVETAKEMLKAFKGGVLIDVQGDKVVFKDGKSEISFKPIEGRYPAWRRVVPDVGNAVATDMTSLNPDYLGAVSKSYSAIARRLKIEIKQVAFYFFGETGAVRISGLSVFAPAFDYLVMPMRIR